MKKRSSHFNINQAQSEWHALDRHPLVIWSVSSENNLQMHPAYTKELGGGRVSSVQIKYEIENEPTNDAMQNLSESQRCEDYAWRRLVIRCSAARRPYKEWCYFQQRIVSEVEMYEVSHAAVVVDEDKTKIKIINSRWCQCVGEKIGPDRMMDI